MPSPREKPFAALDAVLSERNSRRFGAGLAGGPPPGEAAGDSGSAHPGDEAPQISEAIPGDPPGAVTAAGPAAAPAPEPVRDAPRSTASGQGRPADPAVRRRESVRDLLGVYFRTCDVTLFNVRRMLETDGYRPTLATLCRAPRELGQLRSGAGRPSEDEVREVLAPFAEGLGVSTEPPEPLFAAPIEAARRRRRNGS